MSSAEISRPNESALPGTTEFIVVFCTCPNAELAGKLANILVERRLAACVNILPNLTSIYRWEERIMSSPEHLLIIKTHAGIYSAMEKTLQEHHDYEVPEIIALPIQQGLPAYLNWITDSLADRVNA